jgi:hypothetical protein
MTCTKKKKEATVSDKLEIKPRYVDGEPYCTVGDCPKHSSHYDDGDVRSYCAGTLDMVGSESICIIQVQRDRDKWKAMADARRCCGNCDNYAETGYICNGVSREWWVCGLDETCPVKNPWDTCDDWIER